jgi:hypothetical protein
MISIHFCAYVKNNNVPRYGRMTNEQGYAMYLCISVILIRHNAANLSILEGTNMRFVTNLTKSTRRELESLNTAILLSHSLLALSALFLILSNLFICMSVSACFLFMHLCVCVFQLCNGRLFPQRFPTDCDILLTCASNMQTCKLNPRFRSFK